MRRAYPCRWLLLLLLSLVVQATHAQVQVTVVNMVPNARSGETVCDAEPNIAVNPANPLQIAASAFTPDPLNGPNAPIYVSTDGGANWVLNSIVPGNNTTFGTGDITLSFGGASGVLYSGILRGDATLRMNILRTANYQGTAAMTVLVNRGGVDQPYAEATTVAAGAGAGNDRVYVGNNNNLFAGPQTATVDRSLDAAAAAAPAGFAPFLIETRTAAPTGFGSQDGPSIRPAIHADGTIYAAFFGWRVFGATTNTSDIVVVRDDNWGAGATPFRALVEPTVPGGDGRAGVRVARRVTIPSLGTLLGTQRIGSQMSIAVHPGDSSTVYLAWAQGTSANNYTILVRRSTDRGVTWDEGASCLRECEQDRDDCMSEVGRPGGLLARHCAQLFMRCRARCSQLGRPLRAVVRATNPALAISADGTVAFLYQRLTGTAPNQTWETHLELTRDGFATAPTDLVLARTPDLTAATCGAGPLGDYLDLLSIGREFYGVFSANNTPNQANFPQGVTYRRNVNFATNTLLAVDGVTPVNTSSDPFFFRVGPPPPRLTINKVLVPASNPGHFNLQIDGNTVASGVGNGGSSGFQVLSAGSHTVGETGAAGTNTAQYTTIIGGDCSPTGTVVLADGDVKTCTITNLAAPRLTVRKVVRPAGDPGLFNLQIDGVTRTTDVGHGGSTGAHVLSAGAHTVGESAGSGTNLADYSTAFSGACAASGVVSLAPGDDKTCTITNRNRSCLPECEAERADCMADVGQPGALTAAQCMQFFNACRGRC